MVARIGNLIQETTTGTGTGNLTLSTSSGYQSFDTAFSHGATTNVFWYYIIDETNGAWEYGSGHMSDATTLVRDTVVGSTNSNSAVSFGAGTKKVVNDFPAELQITESFGVTIDGAGFVPVTGSKGYITIPYACTITNWYLAANASGSCVIDIKRSSTSIIGGSGNKPTLSSAQSGNAAQNGSWASIEVALGDILEFNLDSVTTITRVNLTVKTNRK